MYSPVLFVPARRVSGWVAETDPKSARAWLDSLPLGNSTEASREIYQALYTLNRLDLRVTPRLDLMALYEPVVVAITAGLQTQLAHAAPPLNPQKRELAEFIRRLHVEMAFGYKCVLRDLSRARLLLGKRQRFRHALERALSHLHEVLIRSYVVYIACPNGVWREIHELYRLAESLEMLDEASDAVGNEPTIRERYVQILLLGIVNPYNLPHNGVRHVRGFLALWGELARIGAIAGATGQPGQFIVDLTADVPPTLFSWDTRWSNETERMLDVQELLRTLRRFIERIEQGSPVALSELGFESVDANNMDLLQRMLRAWGEGIRRRYTRQAREHSNVWICVGLNTLYFFTNGQRPFVSDGAMSWSTPVAEEKSEAPDVAFIELDDLDGDAFSARTGSNAKPTVPETHRVDCWKLRDVGPQGMSLSHSGDAVVTLRVGDLLGVRQGRDTPGWSPAVVRWLKSPEATSLEAGVELLAPSATPVAVRMASGAGAQTPTWFPGLQLPAMEVVRRPSTVLLGRGMCRVGDDLELMAENESPRRVRVMRLLERTGSFEQIVYADVVR